MSEIQKRVLNIVMLCILLVSMYLVAKESAMYADSDSVITDSEKARICVILDAGHGGSDSGKVGVNGVYEKDINLEIARLVQMFLESADVEVVMTRDDDGKQYDQSVSNNKMKDMMDRIAIIEEAEPLMVVSIHQNSYQEEYVHGAQVFYYSTSGPGKELAEILQNSIRRSADLENKREIKANDSYFLLKKTTVPIAIVECGFLSNWEDAEKLSTPYYQEKMAWAIFMGIMQYINNYAAA